MSIAGRLLSFLKNPATVYLGAAVLARVGSFLLIPLYTRRLSLEEYGDYALFLTIVTFLSTFLSGGLVAAISKSYFEEKDKDEGKRRAADVARWLAVSCLLMGGLVAAAVWFIAPESGMNLLGRRSLVLGVAGGAGMAIAAVPWTVLRAEQRAYAAAGFQLVQFVVMTGAGLVLVALMGRGYRGAVEAAAGASVVSGLVSLAYVFRLPRGGMRLRELRRALSFSLPFVPHFIAQWLQGAADRWILRGAGFESELGGYALAAQVVSPVNMVVAAWNDSVGPEMGEHFRAGGIRQLRANLRRVRLSFVAAVLGPGLLLVLTAPLVAMLVGQDFRDALVYVPFLVLALMPDAMYLADYQIVYYSGRTSMLGTATVLAAVINISLNLVLIPSLGAWGAVISRILAGSARSLVVHWIGRTSSDRPAVPPP